jgi:hypothetical protein
VLAPRQHRDQLRCINLVTRHGHLHTAGRPAMTSLRPSGTNHYPAPRNPRPWRSRLEPAAALVTAPAG